MIPATVVATPAAPVVHAPREYMAVVYGLIVVVAGFVAILIALWLIVINANASNTSSTAKGLSDPAAFMGMVSIAIAGLGGAFFGVALGLQGVVNANKERAAAEAAKDAVQMRAERYLAYVEPEVAKTLVK
jgi:ABC-type lipoprotein release transport system permease subunit